MKNVSAPLLALLNSNNQFTMTDFYTFTLKSGSVLRYNSADLDLVYGGYTYSHAELKRGTTKLVIGTEVDNLDISMYMGVNDLINGIPFPQFARVGGFDGAYFSLDRAFLTSWSSSGIVGTINLFTGQVSDCYPSRTEIKLTIKSGLEMLNVPMPKNLYQAGCLHTLYDSGCGLVKSSLGVSGAATSGSTNTVINCNLTAAEGYYDMGSITWTSGTNNGLSVTVKKYTIGKLVLAVPALVAPSTGDTFTVYPGCDRAKDTCNNKFNNLSNFRATPYVPIPETAL